jgi:hypothetical protein
VTKKQQNLNSSDDLSSHTLTPLPTESENNAELQFLDLDQQKSPATVAWALMQKNTASEDQINFMSLLVAPMQKAWLERPCGTHVLPPVSNTHYCRVIGLGGGGCGKSWMLNHMIRPLIRIFFHGINSYYPLCASNAGARLIFGRTFHAACGLGAKAALHTHTCSSIDWGHKEKIRICFTACCLRCWGRSFPSQCSATSCQQLAVYVCPHVETQFKRSLVYAAFQLVWKNFRCPPSG